jgi:hypothetical protein
MSLFLPRPLSLVSCHSVTLCLAFLAPLAGCNEGYTVPGRGADLRAFGGQDGSIDLSNSTGGSPGTPGIPGAPGTPIRPYAQFPAVIAAVRVQDDGYCSPRAKVLSMNNFTVVLTRDVELDQDLETLAKKPMIKAIIPLNRLALTGGQQRGSRDLLAAARNLGADMLLIYTLDSSLEVDHHLPELSFVTLGLAPEGEARSNCTASAVLIDARSGYTYAVAEGSDLSKRLATFWSSDSAGVKATRAAEHRAFKALLMNLCTQWDEVVKQYGPPKP